MSDLASTVYDETSSLGKTYATIQIFIGIFICIILCLCGLYNEFLPVTTAITNAKILKITNNNGLCDRNIAASTNAENVKSESITYNCNLQVTYTVNNQTYTNNISLQNSTPYTVGQTIQLSYNLNDPNIITSPQPDNKTMGSISIIIGILILSSCAVNYYLATQSKLYAATEGVGTSISLLKNVLK